MTPWGWIALAYSLVAATLLAYAATLRRRIRQAEQATRDGGSGGGRPR